MTIAMENYLSRRKPQRIRGRFKPCRCGCKGRDSWHAASFKRRVRMADELSVPQQVKSLDGDQILIMATGWVRLPSGEELVGLQLVEAGEHRAVVGWRRIDSASADRMNVLRRIKWNTL